MIYEGQTENGLKCIKAIRDRFDGQKRNPFDEPECGHHYARAMASWAAVIALSEFQYSGIDQTITFTSKEGTWFWSNGSSWGTVEIKNSGNLKIAKLNVLSGQVTLKSFTSKDYGKTALKKPVTINQGNSFEFRIENLGGKDNS